MEIVLDAVEARVIGSLIEKDITTPEYYPLTLNALVNACNQKSNRDPVVQYDEDTVADAIDRLREKRLMSVLTGGSNRVPKYGHRLGEALNLGRRELAVLCELMVRGPQTLGELNARASRMHRFSDLDEVERTIRTLASHASGPLVTELARQPGRKETRFAHLLSGEPVVGAEAAAEPAAARSGGLESRVTALESEVARLREQLDRVLSELGLTTTGH
jgi:uncharacterized protein YceH (UPF0502 family)